MAHGRHAADISSMQHNGGPHDCTSNAQAHKHSSKERPPLALQVHHHSQRRKHLVDQGCEEECSKAARHLRRMTIRRTNVWWQESCVNLWHIQQATPFGDHGSKDVYNNTIERSLLLQLP